MAWLDKLLYKQHTVHRCCATGGERGGRIKRRTVRRKDKHWKKVGPALIQMCLLRQGAPRTKSMLETRKKPWSKLFPFSLSYFTDLAICLTNFGLHYWTSLPC